MTELNEEKTVYDVEKSACCFIFCHMLEPLILQEEEIRSNCSSLLRQFLEEMDLSFDEFIDYIRFYSLGHGLDYLKECNEYNESRKQMLVEDEDYYMDF